MRKIEDDVIKDIMLQIFDYVDKFCKANNISYTMSGGTLLGAIRHQGFIPWDDDMDMQMLREDYKKFTRLWNHKSSQHPYILINLESGNSPYSFGKIYDPRTIIQDDNGRIINNLGVFIDIFPLDKVVNMTDFKIRHSITKKLHVVKFKLQLNRIVVLTSWLINIISQLCYSRHFQYYYEMVAGLKCKKPIPKKVFLKYEERVFENRRYMSVVDYDTYLTETYGDYMKLPPHHERITPHSLAAYWKDSE